MEDDLLASITFRCSFDFIKEITPLCGRKKPFPDKSAAIRFYIERGQQFESLLKIYNDPAKRAEFEDKLQGLAKEKDLEKYFETCDATMLDSIIFIAQNKRDAKVQQLLIDVKKG